MSSMPSAGRFLPTPTPHVGHQWLITAAGVIENACPSLHSKSSSSVLDTYLRDRHRPPRFFAMRCIRSSVPRPAVLHVGHHVPCRSTLARVALKTCPSLHRQSYFACAPFASVDTSSPPCLFASACKSSSVFRPAH